MDIIGHYNNLVFEPVGHFAFSSSDDVIYYDHVQLKRETNEARLALLHEVSHALLGHFTYASDFELLVMEAEAWHKTMQLCDDFGVRVDQAYIEDCISTYDAWLTARSTCPACQNLCLSSKQPDIYTCFACGAKWLASSDRFNRVEQTQLV